MSDEEEAKLYLPQGRCPQKHGRNNPIIIQRI
jgi:hypothetical protein